MRHRSAIALMIVALATAGSIWADPVPAAPAGKADSLKMAYAPWFAVGTAIPDAGLTEPERQLLFKHFSTVTPENCMKPMPLHPQENRFDFAKADALVDMARTNGLTVNGHALVWHEQCPDWFFMDGGKPASRELVLKRLRSHIAAVAGHFAGKVVSWDVVNEALADNGNYLRQSKWLTSLGEDFIAEAFAAAHQADPKAELYYNDYSIEYPAKRAKALRLIRDLKARQVKLAGIGIQGHWQLDRIPFQEIEDTILAFHAEGLKVMITELDIDVVKRRTAGGDAGAREQDDQNPFANGLPPEMQKRLADQYAQLFALFRKHADKIDRVTFWGLHDGRSWLNSWPSRRTNHPLPWDRDLHPKPALSAILAMASPAQLNPNPVSEAGKPAKGTR